MKLRLSSILATVASVFAFAQVADATLPNIAPRAKVTVSDALDDAHGGNHLNDGVFLQDGLGEWACQGSVTPWGVMHLPWALLEWDEEVTVDRVVLYDRTTLAEHLAGGTLSFSDGTSLSVTCIPNDGSPREIRFPAKKIRWLGFQAGDGAGKDIGLSEIEVFSAGGPGTRFSEWVDPYIETTCGRWFYCTPGGLPMGMVAAHAFTRNKNQGGGGYNYNFNEILGFSQINDWMISGPDIMPVTGEPDLSAGQEGWKSTFRHESEIIRPGYHRLFLDRYQTWVEYTATDRVVFYRFRFGNASEAHVILDTEGPLGNCSMVDGQFNPRTPQSLTGRFSTTDRFWGGPDQALLFYAVETDTPFTTRTEGGRTLLTMTPGRDGTVLMKIALSYTSEENAMANLAGELPGFDFDGTCAQAAATWDAALGKIEVEGGTAAQKTKFYTDLWHVLLGRHKINDLAGTYPDYTGAPYVDKRSNNPLKVRQLPMQDGKPVHNMYGFDAIWLTQWNLNTLWGLAWPEILDDFSACVLQYARNGYLLPRGGCAGGYSFIMTGCPSTSLVVSAYMQGVMTRFDPKEAFRLLRQNHLPGGMMSFENDDDLRFYIRHGWCPDNAGKTLEWAFQDWGLAQMAGRLGRKSDERTFRKRSRGWTALYDAGTGLLMPRDREGKLLHQDPLSGAGWVEANAWQATWSVSHDLERLSAMMGGDSSFVRTLNKAFELAAKDDFIASYSNGYVSYANQPGCSNAHLFSYAGAPWLTQYWVRRVQRQAYSGITPDKGYGGHDEDQGQMGGISALMSIGLFSVTGLEGDTPCYDITSPIFDEVRIHLDRRYCKGDLFVIRTHGNSPEHCYIQDAALNGQRYGWSQVSREELTEGGVLDLWMGGEPAYGWGQLRFRNSGL